MANNDARVLLQWTGKEDIKAKIVKGGEKVLFKKNTIHFADFKVAKNLVSSYKGFFIKEIHEINQKQLMRLVKAIDEKNNKAEAAKKEAEIEAAIEQKEKESAENEETKQLAEKGGNDELPPTDSAEKGDTDELEDLDLEDENTLCAESEEKGKDEPKVQKKLHAPKKK